MNTEVKEAEINEFELEQLPILPLKDLSFFDDEEEKTKDYENLGKIKLCGKVKFTSLPDPTKDTFRFSLISDAQTRTLEINAKTINNTDVPLSDGQDYIFSCDDPIDGIYLARHYKADADLFKDDNFQPGLIRALDMKIFGLEIKSESNRCGQDSLIGLSIFGAPENIEKDEETEITTFEFREKETSKIFSMTFNPKMNHGIEHELKIEENETYFIDAIGLLGDSTFYVKAIFSAQEQVEKILGPKRAKEFCRLDHRQKNEILLYLKKSSECFRVVDKSETTAFRTDDELIEKYRFLQEHYPEAVQRAIESLITSPILVEQQKTKALAVLINTSWSQQLYLNTDYSFLKGELDRTHFGQDALKEYIISTLMEYQAKTKNKGKAFLLVGPPGVGKTSILSTAAAAFGLPYSKISVNGVTTPSFLKGTPRLYNNATYGQIISKINQLGSRCLLIIDEIDKMNCSHDGDPYSALYDLLDGQELFQDEFIEEPIPKHDVLFVFTANSLSGIPEPILDRLEIISVPDYSQEEQRVILTDYIIPKVMDQYYELKLQFSENAIDTILSFSYSRGVRTIEKNVSRLISGALLSMKKEGKPCFQIDECFVRNILEKKIYQNINTNNIKIGF